MKATLWTLVFCLLVLVGCTGQGDPRVAQAVEMDRVEVGWKQWQVTASLGRPQERLGPVQVTEIDTYEVSTWFLPEPGTPMRAWKRDIEYDGSAGVTLILSNREVLRKYEFGYWGEAPIQAVKSRVHVRVRDTLEARQAEWLADTLQYQDLTEKLDFAQKELLEPDEEELPGELASHQVTPARRHARRYISIGY